MGHRRFSDIAGDFSPERRARIDAMKEEARADAIRLNSGRQRGSRPGTAPGPRWRLRSD